MEKKILFPIIAVLGILSINIIFSQNAFAQSATFNLFETGNASDDDCRTITQTGTVVWLGCFASASTTLRINAMSGNSTIATTTLANQSPTYSYFFPSSSNEIILVDISGANEVVRKYQLTGSTITNTQSLTLTNCQLGTFATGQPVIVGTSMFFACGGGTENGKIKVINLNTMTLTSTLENVIQGNCTSPNAIMMVSTTRGILFCDGTEAYTLAVSGTTITLVDDLTGWTSFTPRVIRYTGQTGTEFTVWTADRDGSIIEVATIDFTANTFSSGITSLPSQSDVEDLVAIGIYMWTLDATDDNILVYDWRQEQPSLAFANLSDGIFVFNSGEMGIGSDNKSILVGTDTANLGRYYIVDNIIIDGVPFTGGDDGGGTTTGGIDCTLPANANILICRLFEDTGDDPIVLLPRVGILITTNINNILCSILPIDCDANPDIATNGVGYLYTIVAFGIMLGIFFVATNGQLNKIPTFIWMISSIAMLGALVAINFLDPTFLVIGIIVIVALAAMQIRNSITSGFDFARGDF